jgi:glycosyltransferase involved in cell wall biosynthesis
MPDSVLHILGTAQAESTGIARIVAGLAQGLTPKGYTVHACFLGPPGPLVAMLEGAGAQSVALDLPPGRSLSGMWRLWHELRGRRFSIIHQHAGGRLISRVARSACGAPIVLHLHGRVMESQPSRPIAIRIQGPDIVIASSHSVAQHVTGANVRVIYAGVPIPDRAPDRSANPGKRNVLIGTGCRLAPIKGIPNLVRAFGILRPEFPEVRLEGEGPERGRIADLINQMGLQDRVTLLGWVSDFASVLASWDIFVLPSLEESLPIAALEAMAIGIPVIASAVGGLPEIVQGGETGWLVSAGDPVQLAERLRDLLLQPQDRARMGIAGQARARVRFSEPRMVTEIAEVYNELTWQRPASR